MITLAAFRGAAKDGLSHTKPEVIDDLSFLDPGKVVDYEGSQWWG